MPPLLTTGETSVGLDDISHLPCEIVAAASDGGSFSTARAAAAGSSRGGGGGGGGGSSLQLEDGQAAALTPPGEAQPLPPVGQQLSARALLAGVVVGLLLALLAQRMAMVVGVVPSFQVAALAWWQAVGCPAARWLHPRRAPHPAGRLLPHTATTS